jgi:hypothetical protein
VLDEHKYALRANLAVMHCIDERGAALEQVILAKGRLRENYYRAVSAGVAPSDNILSK